MSGLSRRTRVYLTVDIEGAEERVRKGVAHPPLGYDLRIWGRLSNQRRALGLPLLFDRLGRFGLRATFFLEPLGSSFFGMAGLREVTQALLLAGQDVQLHTHPIQRRVDWFTRGEPALPDNMASYGLDEQAALLGEGLRLLEEAGADRRRLLGFRAGNFGANNDTWAAMARQGLTVSSNLNLCYLRNCAIRWPVPKNQLFAATDRVWELPISTFREGGGYRHLQVTAISFAEMRHFLEEARRQGLGEVTIVTHSFEYFFVDSAARRTGHPNWINIRRLEALCRFLHDRSDDFEVETVGALAARLGNEGQLPRPDLEAGDKVLGGRRRLRYARFAEQALKRLSAGF